MFLIIISPGFSSGCKGYMNRNEIRLTVKFPPLSAIHSGGFWERPGEKKIIKNNDSLIFF